MHESLMAWFLQLYFEPCYEGNDGGCLRLWCPFSGALACFCAHGLASWCLQRCTFQRVCLARARGEQQSKTLADAPRPYVHHLQMIRGYPGCFSQTLPVALCSPGLAGRRQVLAVVSLLCSNGKSDTCGRGQSSWDHRGWCWDACVI